MTNYMPNRLVIKYAITLAILVFLSLISLKIILMTYKIKVKRFIPKQRQERKKQKRKRLCSAKK